MPIAFARLEFVKRSSGKNACAKAAYNSRSQIHSHGNEWQEASTYDWSGKKPPAYHEVLLPRGADPKFKSPEVLWNAVEQKEVRRNSQTAFEMVLALPDDKVISLEDRKHLVKSFIDDHFVKQGLAAQIDIHAPENDQEDHNWHAHVLITTRRFKENGQEFDDHKARELMPVMRGGKVISGAHWGKLWAHHQNAYFEQKGLSLRVDIEGVVPQIHLGPVRMRGRALSLLHEHDLRLSLNTLESENPKNILEKITQTKNIFSAEDIDRFLHKHVDPENVFIIKESFWKQPELVQLLDPKSNKPLNKFTTSEIIAEEKQLLRLGDRLSEQSAHRINLKKADKFSSNLTPEQRIAFHNIVTGKRLACVEGYAGTGKSYLLSALKEAYESSGFTVRGLGPDSATSRVLREKGFTSAQTLHRFLFAFHHGKIDITKNEVWILDEAGKLGTRPLLELLKCANRFGAQVVLSGDSAQLPSVERGSGFKIFSDRYGAERLVDIQRQKEESQREIARKLAVGEMGQALDAIVRLGNIHWTPTKEESIEGLIQAWALNKTIHPNESTLIIAHSNKEVRTLNELARLFRKEAGELKEKEYQCETTVGKIYISCGDSIEFRAKDKELGVENADEGILIKASPESFTVQMKEGRRHVTFDPRQYRSFQLGYATTYYRCQGRTLDKAYVLHSPMMNKEMFYVGLTRHVKKVECYVSEQEAKHLSDLKRQAYRQTPKDSTLEYLTSNDLEKERMQIAKQQQVEALKSSDSMLSKIKGFSLSALEGVRAKTSEIVEQYKDKRPNQSFFNPKIEVQKTPGKVQEVIFEEESKPDEKKICTDLKSIQKSSAISTPPKESNTKEHWKKLPEEKRSLLQEYFKSSDRASSLHTIVKSEAEHPQSPHFHEWQKSCGERNALAYQIAHSFKSHEIQSLFGSKGLDILQDRSARHAIILQRGDNSKLDLDARLKEHLEPLLLKLFPEGPTKKGARSLRFGSNGSLSVTMTGEKMGSFYDFEQQQGGGPLQLIQRSLFCSKTEAITWAKDFLGQAPTVQVPSHFKKPEKQQEWISLKPESAAPSLKELSKGLTIHYKETARYTYRDANGSILFHTLRLEDEKGKKIVLPLSYGRHEGDTEACWSLKGYQTDKKPLYNLHLLKEYPNAKVLIVEGEKTADAASKFFPPGKMICLTWCGGAGAVEKSDWKPLFMREVVVWPDNDKAGFEASDTLCNELRKIGMKSLHEVDRSVLAQALPPKWDLADSLPSNAPKSFIKDVLLQAHEKAVGVPTLLVHLKANSLNTDPHMAISVLSKVEEAHRSALEQKIGLKTPEIRSALLDKTLQILKDRTELKNLLEKSDYTRGFRKENEFSELYEEKNRDVVSDQMKEKELER